MVIASEFYFPSSDGRTLIHVNQWTPLGGPVAGVVQIAHGVAEYGARYEPFARFLCGHGFAVVANDHLGHGKSLVEGCPMVYFGDENGWRHAVEDMEELRRRTAKVFPGVPYFLFGHSMGSFLSRTHLIRYPGRLDGCILCGTGHQSPALIAGGKLIADREIRRLGRKAFSVKADKLAFGAYNQRFQPTRTRFDWISANEANVDAYIADPLCGCPSGVPRVARSRRISLPSATASSTALYGRKAMPWPASAIALSPSAMSVSYSRSR